MKTLSMGQMKQNTARENGLLSHMYFWGEGEKKKKGST